MTTADDREDSPEVEVDLCPKCFKDRLIPWLKSQGATIEAREWEF